MADLAKPKGRPKSFHDKTDQNTIQALDRALGLLEIVAARSGLTLSDLAAKSDQAVATVYRALVTLQGRGMVEVEDPGQLWHIGGGAFRVGSAFLRRTKLDELPQLWNVLLGDMSLVGPRPGLFNQNELTAARSAQGVFAARPGITGLAQVNGIDMSTPELLAKTDAQMLRELSVTNYFRFIVLTVLGKGTGDAAIRQ